MTKRELEAWLVNRGVVLFTSVDSDQVFCVYAEHPFLPKKTAYTSKDLTAILESIKAQYELTQLKESEAYLH